MLEKTLRYIALAGIFALPFVSLLVASSLFFPYITGKNFAFRILVEISAAAWLALALISPAYRPRRSWVLGALAIFVLIIGIADVFGAYAFKSLWSNFERMDGWVTLAHLLVYTVVAASMLQTEKLWRWLWWTTLGVSAYVSLYGFLQVTGRIALGLGGESGLSGRIDATFGNPIYMAVYMLFHIFIAAMLWSQQWVEKGEGRRLYMSLAYGGIIAVDTLALFLTGTRGTMIGLIGGAFLSALIMLVLARNSRTVWRFSAAFVAGILLLAGGFFLVKDSESLQKIGFLKRLATISLQENTVKARFINWSMAWKGVQERPILGWGQENYALVFDKYFDPRMYGQEPWFDRVHNIVFDWLVAGGFLGFFAYIAIFIATLWAIWRSGGFSMAERALLTGLLAGYFVHNFFVFDNVTSYILFGTVLAFIAYRSGKARNAPLLFENKKYSTDYLPYTAVIFAIALLFVGWAVNQRALAANRLLLAGLGSQSSPSVNLDLIKQSIALGTMGTQEAREQLAQITAQIAGNANIPENVKKEFFDTATLEMKKQQEASPLDARFPLFLAAVYKAYGLDEDAKVYFEKALELSPRKQAIMFELADNATARGDAAAALDYFKRAYELDTSFEGAAIAYASQLIRMGRAGEGEALLAPLIEKGAAADQRVLSAYRARNQLARAVPIWEARIKATPMEVQPYFTLAAIHYLLGDRTSSIATLESAKRIIPGIAGDVDPLIQEVQSGTAQVE